MMTSTEIRKKFLDYFASRQHQIVPSAPMVVKNDPTLMFINSGMAPFKSIFLGESPAKYPRLADTQKCLRVSGKHNDLEDVGFDTYHHTMFEMLGNWSFGDYFKKEAIQWAWELLTDVYQLPKDRLYVTVFEGDAKEKLDRDNEAHDLWKSLIDESRIINGNKKDNFWEMGDTGPCGPCSEIHVDLRTDEERVQQDGKSLVNADHPQVVEIWNLVFMQFERKANGSLIPLPARHVDTGMGFERLCMALQGKKSNYDTDIFQPLISFVSGECNIKYGAEDKADIAMRVIADHIRAIAFAIADGQLPSNIKAGYVIRRILRRAVRYGYTFLGFKDPFLFKLVDILSLQMGEYFSEMKSQKDFVKKVILEEEQSFLRTLATGIQRFEKYVEGKNKMEGSFAFELYDTYGFPIDLTQLMAREKGISVDMDSFHVELEKQKERSRAATSIDTDDWVVLSDEEGNEFVGYDVLETESKIIKYRKVKSKGKEQYQLVLDKTPFYAESGGQVGDTGMIAEVPVTDTKKENNLVVHFTDKLPSKLDQLLPVHVNADKRISTANNHSATHLLHAALKKVLGNHVNQKGSLVNEDYLRFDFSHFSKLSDTEIDQIETIVNEKIRTNIALDEKRNVPYEEAINSGVTALFGEKYGDFVRVITFDSAFSKELCGGTHVANTGQIGFFKVISESAVAAGVRRIEAVTGIKAEQLIHQQFNLVREIKQLLKNEDVLKTLSSLQEENSRMKKEMEQMFLQQAQTIKKELLLKAEEKQGIHVIIEKIDLPSAEAIKSLAFEMKAQLPKLFLVLAAEIETKAHLTVIISDDLVAERKWNASNIIRDLAKEIQGGGGGQAFYATAGGKKAEGIESALSIARGMM